MSVGIGVFLRLASPSGGRLQAPGSSWLLAGLVTCGVVLAAVTFGSGQRSGASPSRRAAVLGAATGISWGFVAAVIKELSSHLDDGLGAIFSSWPVYVLLAAGAATMLLASHALAAGPLAASQPGFTVLDPLSAGLLGVCLFGEHIRTGVFDLAGEALALAVVFAGASALSHSCLILGEDGNPSCLPDGFAAPTERKQLGAPEDGTTRRLASLSRTENHSRRGGQDTTMRGAEGRCGPGNREESAMRGASVSIEELWQANSEDGTRASRSTEPGDPGPC
jgi:hypothetical protein